MSKYHESISGKEFTSLQSGCEKAFRAVYDLYHATLYRYAFYILNDRVEAEEIVQEVLIAFFKSRLKINSPEGIYPYLFTLTKRQLITRFRNNVVKAKFRDHLTVQWSERTNNTEEAIRASDLQSLLEGFVNQLPPRQKEIYLLSRQSGLSYKEISQSTGVSVNTVKNQLITASRKIKAKIEKHYFTLFIFFSYLTSPF